MALLSFKISTSRFDYLEGWAVMSGSSHSVTVQCNRFSATANRKTAWRTVNRKKFLFCMSGGAGETGYTPDPTDIFDFGRI
jgi:hypothetical protein